MELSEHRCLKGALWPQNRTLTDFPIILFLCFVSSEVTVSFVRSFSSPPRVYAGKIKKQIKYWFQGRFSWGRTQWSPGKDIRACDLCSDLSHTLTTANFSSKLSWKVWQHSRKSCLSYISQQLAVHISNFQKSQLGMLTPKAHWCQHNIEEGSTLQEISPQGHTWFWFISALLADFGLNPLCCSVPIHRLTHG